MADRKIVLDTETTGLETKDGHRIIEIGCIELINRRLTGNNYHVYINPERVVDEEAIAVHGITNEFLQDKPVFAQIANEFYHYIQGAELVIHNAAFDIKFIDHEFKLFDRSLNQVHDICSVIDSLALARRMHPGQKNNLDALCRRYDIDNSKRELHGALLDAGILTDVYLAMTGGQTSLSLGQESADALDENDQIVDQPARIRQINRSGINLAVVTASTDEFDQHIQYLNTLGIETWS
ncbi:DNA polymerase III subunit epsilon [Piscirickettsia salmonis]|uniref:DNA polymerase III subunit epsilon n=1 Tax=Piscirickettsia salmonis TaxID=1238 RepID=UPI0012B777D7|nr:DNA polymerase III subunit epsilon [Piscirickettsia salmonis]QGP50262.1 DNA polymerase III subunit epsilon [Piscirickettsia salmonis]QGP54744.1 DNA polymerase III subunit epsilon [Piscirickettsia salmonis]QGP59360.1 DNA polymerase III subunit epsilon [Piscirickettsia salmonis]QGP64065.1 DNA polymerase III subunit epsilon [Piscirickettsia salmonis]